MFPLHPFIVHGREWNVHCSIFLITTATEGGQRLCFHHCLSVCLFVCLWAWYLKKLWTDSDGTWWTGWVCDKDELIRFLVKFRILIRIRNFFLIFQVILHHKEMGPKTIYSVAWYVKMCTDYDKTWWMSWVGDKNKPIRFWYTSGCRSSLSVGHKT